MPFALLSDKDLFSAPFSAVDNINPRSGKQVRCVERAVSIRIAGRDYKYISGLYPFRTILYSSFMDIVAHALYGVTLCSRIGLPGGRKGLPGRRWYRDSTVWWAMLFGILPDVVSMWIPFGAYALSGVPDNFFVSFGGAWLIVYHVMHSLVVAIAFSSILFFLHRKMFVPSLAWAVHVLCDVVSHSAGKFQTMPLYPFSRWGIDGIAFWLHPEMVIGYWALLVIIWISLMIIRRRPDKTRGE